MEARAKFRPDDNQVFAVTLSAPVSDWRALMKQMAVLKDQGWVAWPASGFVSCVENMLSDLEKTYSAYADPTDSAKK